MISTTASTRTHRRYVQNIISTWKRASEDQLARGRTWYRTAHDLADLMSEGNVTAGAGVLAALSVQKSPEDPEAVVIDRHAHDVAVGKRYGNMDRGLSNKRRYATLAHAYREAARQLGELPSTVQAVT
jgi:hypothetical protein